MKVNYRFSPGDIEIGAKKADLIATCQFEACSAAVVGQPLHQSVVGSDGYHRAKRPGRLIDGSESAAAGDAAIRLRISRDLNSYEKIITGSEFL
jgi:hypothetical protein